MRKGTRSVILLLFLSFCPIVPGAPPQASISAALAACWKGFLQGWNGGVSTPSKRRAQGKLINISGVCFDGAVASATRRVREPRPLRFGPLHSFSILQTGSATPRAGIDTPSPPQGLEDIRKYISVGWGVLTRSEAKCETFSDPKTGGKSLLYLPAGFSIPAATAELEKRCSIRAEHLPAVIEKLGGINVNGIRPHGLLYLENPYVVPGGMFNEMYGWDSYFILRGLLREGKLDLARGIGKTSSSRSTITEAS